MSFEHWSAGRDRDGDDPLALTRIPATMNEPAQNCHFEDSFQDGELKFDYRLHPGIVQTSNALKLMQIAGLEIEEQVE